MSSDATPKIWFANDVHHVVIPDDTTRVCVMIRHAPSVQDGLEQERTLTHPGAKLAIDCEPHYRRLIGRLEARFRDEHPENQLTAYHSSATIRAILTLYLMTGCTSIGTNYPDFTLRMMKSPNDEEGTWAGNEEKKDRDRGLDRFIGIIKTADSHRPILVACGHDWTLSLAALRLGFVQEGFNGLGNCQAFIYFLDKDYKVLGICLFTPQPTLDYIKLHPDMH